jgi:hypothetical protein
MFVGENLESQVLSSVDEDERVKIGRDTSHPTYPLQAAEKRP